MLLRQAGTTDPTEVWRAILETNGQLSVLLYADRCAPTAADLQVKVAARNLPVTIISDGRILRQNLHKLGLDQRWLTKQLKAKGLTSKEVFLFTHHPDGTQYWLRQEEPR